MRDDDEAWKYWDTMTSKKKKNRRTSRERKALVYSPHRYNQLSENTEVAVVVVVVVEGGGAFPMAGVCTLINGQNESS